jgi:cystathionine beta-lyase/cystathionine gamma-synthase
MKKKKPTYVVRPPTAILTRGFDPTLSVGSARPAVFRSSTYVFRSLDLIYARLSHPNAEILEDQIVPLERGATAAAVFNSGMAAISTIFLTFCAPGQKFVYTAPVYGGTEHLIQTILRPHGIEGIPIDAGDGKAFDETIRGTDDLRMVFLETPANPTLRMTDLARIVKAARERPVPPMVVVDNTFLGPTFQHPLALGIDLTVYSATKYLAGFSDMLGGVAMSADAELIAALRGTRAVLGNILQPDECWLLDSRLVSVGLRMSRQSKNAQNIAEALDDHPKIEKVVYPSLFTDPEQMRIRDAQCDYAGGIITLLLKGGRPASFTFLRSLTIARNAVSLGGVETLACHPRTTTHSEMSEEMLERAGIGENLVRLSIGVEDWRDLLRDIRTALDAI